MTFWVAGAALVAGTVGAVVSSDSARKAANTQKDAANQSNALQQSTYDSTVARNQPFVTGGTDSYNQLLQGLNNGRFSATPTGAQVQAEPGYQFGMDQGMNALNRQLNARGWGGSGASAKAAAEFGNNYGSQQYGNAFSRLMQSNQQNFQQYDRAASIGQSSANNTAVAGANYANTSNANTWGGAVAGSANAVSQGNIWTNALNQGVSAYKNAAGTQAGIGTGVGFNGNGGGIFGSNYLNGYGGSGWSGNSGSQIYGDGYGPM